ncbi:RsmB/NOP family class I SAM-dependent RNA methyltransferase [Rhodococcoides fascians]|uniref:RsmB/NOP family class I SAM-dependent RNA methyltransferase n=1 Tax=Rhodococcoides fascians TaxID=1828 RepID=UPI00050C7C86|nr:transcription antitermination factor NusB [Rhodococcus fascians]
MTEPDRPRKRESGQPRKFVKKSPGARGPKGNRPPQGAGPRAIDAIDPARRAARDVLKAVRERDAYANLVLPGLLRERKLDSRDAALATELAYGASRARGVLDAVIAHAAGRPAAEIDGPLLDILRLGSYQLLRTRVAPHAAVATSVDLARSEFGTGKAGFVNAVLRRVSERTAAQWVDELAPPAASDPVGHLAFEYAHPKWIAQAFADALGADAGELAAVLEADDARPSVHLVARPGEISAEELALVTGGEEGPYSPYAVHLDGGDPGKLDAVRDGLAGVQDEGSQLVGRALTLAPLVGADGGRWLDLCAGPGGKAALLGAIAEIDGATVDAVEPTPHRADLVSKTTKDLPVTVHTVDGRQSGLDGGYDRVLVDAPCTGLGALRRRPEARWRRLPSDVGALVTLQKELLAAAIDLVRPGGVVLYSTCSPHLSETTAVVADAVRRFGVEPLDTRELVPGVPQLGDGTSVQLWPHRHGTDAMFMAALRKPM